MTRRPSAFSRTVLVMVAALGLSHGALAQSASCDRYRVELASLDRAGAQLRGAEAAEERQRAELARLSGYYRSIGCGQGFLFFQPPAECGAIAERIRAVQSNIAAVASQAIADPDAVDARRRQLRAAIAKACDAGAEGPRISLGGDTRLVCVRSCDGAFFPLENRPDRGASAETLCRALCPSAEVSVYRAPRYGNIEDAVSETGKPYMQLANALRFQKTYDPSCSCCRPGQSWAEALQRAETMIARRSTDVVVTVAMAEKLSRAGQMTPRGDTPHSRPADVAKARSAPAGGDVEATGSVRAAPAAGGSGPLTPRVISPEVASNPR
jgi:hypothetical protein